MFMLEAYRLGMTEGDYVFYTVEMVPDENVLNPEDVWASNDGQNDIARKAFEAVFHVRSSNVCLRVIRRLSTSATPDYSHY